MGEKRKSLSHKKEEGEVIRFSKEGRSPLPKMARRKGGGKDVILSLSIRERGEI